MGRPHGTRVSKYPGINIPCLVSIDNFPEPHPKPMTIGLGWGTVDWRQVQASIQVINADKTSSLSNLRSPASENFKGLNKKPCLLGVLAA